MLATLLLAACPVLMPSAVSNDPVVPSPAEVPELVSASYDLSVLHGPDRERQLHLPLLPGLSIEQHEQGDDHETVLAEVVESMLVDLIHAEEMQYAGRGIGRVDHSLLLLTAPQPVHDDARRLIEYLSLVSHRQAVLRFDDFSITDASPDVSSRDLDDLVEQGVLVPAGSRRETVPLGVAELRGGLRSVPFVSTWEPEIASGSATIQPVFEIRRLGTQALIHVAPAGDGGAFSVAVMASQDGLLQLEDRIVSPPVVAVLDAGARSLFSDVHVELPHIGVSRLMGSAVVEPGGSLWLGASTVTLEGRRGVFTRVVLESVTPEPAPLRFEQGTLRVVDVSRALWSGVRVGDLDSAVLTGEGAEMEAPMGYRHADMPEIHFPGGDLNWDRAVHPALESFQDEGGLSWSEGGLVVLWSQDDAVDAAARSLAQALAPPPGGVFTWGLEDGNGQLVASGQLPVEAGRDAFTLVGEARTLLQGTDVDVATGAFAHKPHGIDVLDGLGLRVRTRSSRALVQLARAALADHDRVELGRDLIDLFDRTPADRIDLRVSVPADGLRHDLGRVDPGDEPLTLWARLVMSPGDR